MPEVNAKDGTANHDLLFLPIAFHGLRRSTLEFRGESILGLTEELELRRLRSL
jgi:hypothetical protein